MRAPPRVLPPVDIDCPPEIEKWDASHIEKAENLVNYVENGLPDGYGVDHSFADVSAQVKKAFDSLGQKGPLSSRRFYSRYGEYHLSHALACLAYLRHGLTTWQQNNVPWVQVAIYIAERRLEFFDGGSQSEGPATPLPKDDSSPGLWAKR